MSVDRWQLSRRQSGTAGIGKRLLFLVKRLSNLLRNCVVLFEVSAASPSRSSFRLTAWTEGRLSFCRLDPRQSRDDGEEQDPPGRAEAERVSRDRNAAAHEPELRRRLPDPSEAANQVRAGRARPINIK